MTWTPAAGEYENRPMNCVNWYEAYAFCIWDDGFLATEAELNYAAAAGDEQRVYPWSIPASSQTIDCSLANFGGPSFPDSACVTPGVGGTNDVGSESPEGDGKFGQADLSGNIWEWTPDRFAPFTGACSDCVNETAGSPNRTARGGSFEYSASALLTANRFAADH